jgi:tetratricopeptide (TPR) repeat protein
MQPPRALNLLQLAHALARCDCALGDAGAGMSSLRNARARADELRENANTERAAIAESAALCEWVAGRHERALAEIDSALAADRDAGPGYAWVAARRWSLRAKILNALNRPDEATQAQRNASTALAAVGLTIASQPAN